MNKKLKIALANDHAGYELKLKIREYLTGKGYEIKDFGSDSAERTDYPDWGHPMALAVGHGEFDFGFSMCGSGNGINMTANKHQNIRSALCWLPRIAEMARRHNDANICALPARYIDFETALEIVNQFLDTEFDGGRHQNRIDKIPWPCEESKDEQQETISEKG